MKKHIHVKALWSTLIIVMMISLSSYTHAQSTRSLSVQARVLEQLKGNIRAVPNAPLNLIGLGEYATDESGRFAFSMPMEELEKMDNQIVIKVNLSNYDVIKPYQGRIELDTTNAHLDLDILVMGRDIEEEYREKLTELSKRLRRTEKRNELSLKRMNAMNDSLVNAMQKDALQKAELQESINELQLQVEKDAAKKTEFEEKLKEAQQHLDQLESTLDDKEEELFLALEERYLRQQSFQKSVSSELKDYLIHIKDVQELLQHLDRYFKPGKYPNYAPTYNKTLGDYNGVFESINENYLDYVQGIDRYWENPLLAEQVEETFEILFDQVHHPKLKPAITEINAYIRKNKPGKASKIAHEAFHDLNPLILNLEKTVNRVLERL